MNYRVKGFTLVELLIVIVIIAILAAISIVAYNGIQERATNAQMVSVVDTYKKAFMMYKTVEGTASAPYPNQTSGLAYTNCLGTGYTYNGDHCQYQDGSPGDTASESDPEQATLRSILSEYIGSTPTISPSKYYETGTGIMRSGVIYHPGVDDVATATLDRHKPRIDYYLNGTDKDCTVGGAVQSSPDLWGLGTTHCTVYLPY